MSFTFAHYWNMRRLVSARDTRSFFVAQPRCMSLLKFPDVVTLIGVRFHSRSVAHI